MDEMRGELVDQVHAGIGYIWYMKNRGRGRDRGMGRGIRPYTGGAKVRVPVIWAKNTNTKTYSKFENLTVNATDEQTSGYDDMKNMATTVGISGQEMDENQGEFAKRDLLRDKVDIAELSMKEELERLLIQGIVGTTGAQPTRRHQPGNNGKDFNPLGYLIQKEFSNLDGIHAINQNTETWWRNQVKLGAPAGATHTFAEMFLEMANLYNNCSKGSTNDAVDLILASQDYFEFYEAGLQPQQRYGNYGDEAAASAGFETVKFKGALMFWSEFMPGFGATATDSVDLNAVAAEACALFLNTRWLELVVSSRVNFVTTPFVEPYDQDAIWSKILLRAQHICKQRRKLGLHHNVVTA